MDSSDSPDPLESSNESERSDSFSNFIESEDVDYSPNLPCLREPRQQSRSDCYNGQDRGRDLTSHSSQETTKDSPDSPDPFESINESEGSNSIDDFIESDDDAYTTSQDVDYSPDLQQQTSSELRRPRRRSDRINTKDVAPLTSQEQMTHASIQTEDESDDMDEDSQDMASHSSQEKSLRSPLGEIQNHRINHSEPTKYTIKFDHLTRHLKKLSTEKKDVKKMFGEWRFLCYNEDPDICPCTTRIKYKAHIESKVRQRLWEEFVGIILKVSYLLR